MTDKQRQRHLNFEYRNNPGFERELIFKFLFAIMFGITGALTIIYTLARVITWCRDNGILDRIDHLFN